MAMAFMSQKWGSLPQNHEKVAFLPIFSHTTQSRSSGSPPSHHLTSAAKLCFYKHVRHPLVQIPSCRMNIIRHHQAFFPTCHGSATHVRQFPHIICPGAINVSAIFFVSFIENTSAGHHRSRCSLLCRYSTFPSFPAPRSAMSAGGPLAPSCRPGCSKEEKQAGWLPIVDSQSIISLVRPTAIPQSHGRLSVRMATSSPIPVIPRFPHIHIPSHTSDSQCIRHFQESARCLITSSLFFAFIFRSMTPRRPESLLQP